MRASRLVVYRGKNEVWGISTPENAADDHPESVGVDILDSRRGFDDTASNQACLPPGQLSAAEGVGEHEVVQTRNTTEGVQRDCTDSMVERVGPTRV